MKKLLALLALTLSASAFAAAEIKEVCKDKIDKAGKLVMKAGVAVQDCKKIKVHKKLEGTAVPEDKKKK